MQTRPNQTADEPKPGSTPAHTSPFGVSVMIGEAVKSDLTAWPVNVAHQ